VKHRDTREILIGGVVGPIDRPEVLIAGLYRDGDLVVVGRTTPLTPAQSAAVGAVLRPAKAWHPWPAEISSHRWGGKDSKKPLTKVDPVVGDDPVPVDELLQAAGLLDGPDQPATPIEPRPVEPYRVELAITADVDRPRPSM
jgi:hypothetical protein